MVKRRCDCWSEWRGNEEEGYKKERKIKMNTRAGRCRKRNWKQRLISGDVAGLKSAKDILVCLLLE